MYLKEEPKGEVRLEADGQRGSVNRPSLCIYFGSYGHCTHQYLPDGEFMIHDPDGYTLMIAQSAADTP